MNENVTCPKCGKSFSKKGIGSHMWRVHGPGISFIPSHKSPWNKGLSRKTSTAVNSISTQLERVKTPLELELDDDNKLIQRWRNKCVNAKKEGIECKLTFDEYCQLVKDAGLKSSQLGFTGEGYVLARYNDSGDYEIGNCRFITQKENSDEKNDRIFWHNKKHEFSYRAFVDYYNTLESMGIDVWNR
jgi:hypothetical protein